MAKKSRTIAVRTSITMENLTLVRAWLALAVGALAVAGVFAIMLGFARADWFAQLLGRKDIFRTALVVHVNLSVLVWLLSAVAALWVSLLNEVTLLSKATLLLAYISAIIFAASPFLGDGTPYLNNYVPVYDNDWFWAGLLGFGAAITLQACITLGTAYTELDNPFSLGIYGMALIVVASALSFGLSYYQLEQSGRGELLDPEQWFEMLFWGGGHLLQFAYVQLALLIWILLISLREPRIRYSRAILFTAFGANIILAWPMPFIYSIFTVMDAEYVAIFTEHMRWGGGIAVFILVIPILGTLAQALNKRYVEPRPQDSLLLWSLLMFTVGGLLAFQISEINTVIPAHYHGSIVAITMAVMGLVYSVFPMQLGGVAKWQPHIYGVGQLTHIIGLAMSGGYGALRKNPEALESIGGKISMGLMGFGTLLAAIGGLLFVWVVLQHGLRCMQPWLAARLNIVMRTLKGLYHAITR